MTFLFCEVCGAVFRPLPTGDLNKKIICPTCKTPEEENHIYPMEDTEFFTMVMITKIANNIISKVKGRKLDKKNVKLNGKEKFRCELLSWWKDLDSEKEKKNEEKK